MTYDPRKHNRRSIRLKGYNYSSAGWYFLTLCLQNRECRFGKIEKKNMVLNAAGRSTDEWWNKIPEKFPNARLDVYQIMPNHFHAIVGIIELVGADPRISLEKEPNTRPNKTKNHNQGGHVGPPQPGPTDVGADPRIGPGNDDPPQQPDFEPRPASIPGIVQWFKTMTTNKYIKGVKKGQFPPFDRKLWQRNYYDHIIREEKSLERIRNYIINNPGQWDEDRNNPNNF